MSHQDDSDNSANGNQKKPTISTFDHPAGAACLEIIENEIPPSDNPSSIENIEKEDIDDFDELPLPPPSSPTFPTLYNDFYGQSAFSRRFSCLPSNLGNSLNIFQRNRAPSLPALGSIQIERLNPDDNFKKLLFDNSRRSSFESAYHSHASDRSSKTPITNSQLEDLEYSMEDDLQLERMVLDESLARDMMERRNSLSYEAIRAYFLEFNPYMQPIENSFQCLDHDNNFDTSSCPNCNQRRTSTDQINIHFRTNAHRRVVERQFEELLNIPDPRQSRSTSIDLFAGLDIPVIFMNRNDPQNENPEENRGNIEDPNES